jgi:Na+/H+ antiporter NhaD/arsenite permease-like protein
LQDASYLHLPGAGLNPIWSLPFAGLLLSFALLPLLAPQFWEHHFGKVAAFWACAFLVPCAVVFGIGTAAYEMLHALLLDYLPFIILLFALFVMAGGIHVAGNLTGTPWTNTALLAFGTLIASLFGTTGASMLLIRPVIRANQDRKHNVHVFVFFIFLVSNIGGSLTPLGDPPLFLGFINGVDFFWVAETMFAPMMFLSASLLALFYLLDCRAWRDEADQLKRRSSASKQIRIEGLHNVIYLGVAVAAVLVGGIWKPGIDVPVGLGLSVPLSGLLRDSVLLILSYLSWRTTAPSIRVENAFAWLPIQEVAMLFAAIFITIVPVLAVLRAGSNGALARLLDLVSRPDGTPIEAAYFWMTGLLSSFLDNAPTYLVFFNLAGGDAEKLMGPLAGTLFAISAGAVFMGALTYIGNAPNFMVRSVCEERGIKMPSFFGYMLWSGAILLPLFAVLSLLFFI